MRPPLKKRCMLCIGPLMMLLFLSGCGKGGMSAVRGLNTAGVSTVLADVPLGFTPSSRVSAIDDHTYLIGVEAVLPPGFSKWNLPFQLPPGRSISAVQGTISHRAACFSQALGVVAVDGRAMPTIVKLGPNGGASTVFVNYTIPVSYTNGEAAILLEADPVSTCTGTTTWEFQGMIRVE
jgi:hypothetical protein